MEKRSKFALDSALRNLYYAFRNRVIIVAIEFKHNGRIWRADTIEEAKALRDSLEAEDEATLEAGGELPYAYREQVWTPDTVTDLLKNTGALQERFLRIIAESKTTSDELVKKLHIGSEIALAGVLSGLSKQLKKMNLKPSDLYVTDVSWTGKTKTRTFSLLSEFAWAAGELGWPEKWPKK